MSNNIEQLFQKYQTHQNVQFWTSPEFQSLLITIQNGTIISVNQSKIVIVGESKYYKICICEYENKKYVLLLKIFYIA